MAKGSIWSSIFVRLLAFEVLCQFGMAIVNPIVSSYAVALGVVVAIAGLVAGLVPFSAMCLRPVGGLVLGRLRQEKLLLLASCVFAASSLLCVLSASALLLMLSRIVMGAAFVVKSSVVVAFASLVVPEDKIGQGVGVIGLAYTVSYALAPVFGSWIGAVWGYRAVFFVSTALFLGAVGVALSFGGVARGGASLLRVGGDCLQDDAWRRVKHETRTEHGRLAALFHMGTIPFSIVAIFETLVQGTMVYLVLLVADQRGIAGASAFFLVYAAATALVRPFSSRLYDKYGLKRVLYPEAFVMSLCPLLAAFAYDTPMLVASAVALALGQGSLHPCFQAESVRGVQKEDSAMAANTFYMGSDMGIALGPAISGIVLQLFGATAMFLVCAAMGLSLAVAYFVYDRMGKGIEVEL